MQRESFETRISGICQPSGTVPDAGYEDRYRKMVWTMPIRNWGNVRGELEIMYPDRMQI